MIAKKHHKSLLGIVLLVAMAVFFSTLDAEAAVPCPEKGNVCVYPSRDAFIDASDYYEKGRSHDLYVGYDETSNIHDLVTFLKFERPAELADESTIEKIELAIYVEFIQGDPQLIVSGIYDQNFWPQATDRSDQEILNRQDTEQIKIINSKMMRGEWIFVDVTDYVKGEMMSDHDIVTFLLEGRAMEGVHYVLFEDTVNGEGILHDDARFGSRLVYTYTDMNPPEGSFTINDGALSTNDPNVTLEIYAEDAEKSYPLEMRFRNENSDWSDWQEVTQFVDWKLTDGAGKKTVYMEVRDAVRNVGKELIYSEIILETPPPIIDETSLVATKFLIEGGADVVKERTVTLSVYANEPLPELEMRFRNETNKWGDWEPAKEERPDWQLSAGKGMKTVYLQLRDEKGNESNILKATVGYDTGDGLEASFRINDGGFYTNSTRVTLRLDVAGSLSNLEMRFSHDDENWRERDWETARSTKQWTLRSTNGVQMVYMQIRDALGNITTDQQFVLLDTQRPTGTLKIENGATTVSTNQVVLNLTSRDESPLEVRFSNDNSGRWSSWEKFKEEFDWTLSSGTGQKTVRMQLRDAAGNVSTTISDTITIQRTTNDPPPLPTQISQPEVDVMDDVGIESEVEWEACGADWIEPSTEILALIQEAAERSGIHVEMVRDVLIFPSDFEEQLEYETVSFQLDDTENIYAAVWLDDETLLPASVQTDGNCLDVYVRDSGPIILFRNESYFSDVVDHWANERILDMANRLILSGLGQGRYEPDRPVTRAEFATALVRTLGIQSAHSEQHFSDVAEQSWAFPYVETAHEFGLISGYNDGTFRPNQSINRQEAAIIIFNAMQLTGVDTEMIIEVDEWLSLYSDQEEVSEWARQAIALNIQYGIMRGDNQARLMPKNELTRAQMAVLLAEFNNL